MPSNSSKYSQQMREETAKFILQNKKSATSVAEELGINVNTVCRWVRECRRTHGLPGYAEEKGITRAKSLEKSEQKYRIKELKMKLKKKEKELSEEREKAEILKKSLHIFMQPRK